MCFLFISHYDVKILFISYYNANTSKNKSPHNLCVASPRPTQANTLLLTNRVFIFFSDFISNLEILFLKNPQKPRFIYFKSPQIQIPSFNAFKYIYTSKSHHLEITFVINILNKLRDLFFIPNKIPWGLEKILYNRLKNKFPCLGINSHVLKTLLTNCNKKKFFQSVFFFFSFLVVLFVFANIFDLIFLITICFFFSID